MAQGHKFLIVDDDIQMRRLLKRSLLMNFPYGIYDEAKNGIEALEIMAANKPTLVIIDFNMPELNGTQTCALIRRNKEMDDVIVVVVSAEPMPDLKEKVMNAGANAFITKPFQLEVFLRLISQLMENRSK